MKVPFSIKANLTLEDYFIVNNYSQSKSRTFTIYGTIVLFVSAAHFYKGMETVSLSANITITLLTWGVSGLVLWYVLSKQKKQLVQNYEQYLEGFEDKEMTFTEEEICIKSPQIETIAQWSAFSKIEEKEDFIYLYNNNNQVHVIPKRSFDKKEAVDFFLNWVSEKLKQ